MIQTTPTYTTRQTSPLPARSDWRRRGSGRFSIGAITSPPIYSTPQVVWGPGHRVTWARRGSGRYGLGQDDFTTGEKLESGAVSGGSSLIRAALGGASPIQLAKSATVTALATAASVDPEPISKAILTVAALVAAPIIGMFQGCGQTCIAATKIVNDVAPYLEDNLKHYFAGPRTASTQRAALQLFDEVWQYVVQHCSNPQLGDAGVRCVTDRQRGACHWKDDSGNCWNWFSGFRDPIANDPEVKPDPVTSTLETLGIPEQVAGIDTTLLFASGLVLLVLLLPGGGR